MSDDKLPASDYMKEHSILEKLDALLAVPARRIQYEVVWAVLDAAVHSKNCDVLSKLGSHKKLVDIVSYTDHELTEEVFSASLV